jgi:hypothetical protein
MEGKDFEKAVADMGWVRRWGRFCHPEVKGSVGIPRILHFKPLRILIDYDYGYLKLVYALENARKAKP